MLRWVTVLIVIALPTIAIAQNVSIVGVGLAVILLIQLRLGGIGAKAAGIGAFHGAAQFTLMTPCRSGCTLPFGAGCVAGHCRRDRPARGGAGCRSCSSWA